MPAPGDYIGRFENFKAPLHVFANPGVIFPAIAEKKTPEFNFLSLFDVTARRTGLGVQNSPVHGAEFV